MRRRDFIALFVSILFDPLAASAQQVSSSLSSFILNRQPPLRATLQGTLG